MNRQQRRTQGKEIIERLKILHSSPILQDNTFKSLPQEDIDQLIKGEHTDKPLQKKYDLMKRLLKEMVGLEVKLNNMKIDLAAKSLPKISRSHQPIGTPDRQGETLNRSEDDTEQCPQQSTES